MKTLYTKTKLATATLLILSLSACKIQLNVDGQTVADVNISKTGIISNKNGNISVNDTPIDTNSTTVIVDGVETDSASLKDGMLVTVTGTESSDGTAKAQTIRFEDDVEGEVLDSSIDASGTGSLNVLGQTVLVDTNTVFESNDINDFTVNDVDIGNIVEVSGYSNTNGEIQATRIEVKNADYTPGEKMELKGSISKLDGNTFSIGELTILADSAVLDDRFNNVLKNGQYVEVSSYNALDANGNLIASEIKLKSENGKAVEHDKNDEKVEIKGAITTELNNNELEINGAKIMLDSGSTSNEIKYGKLKKGNIVEAEGYINTAGVFVATKLELDEHTTSGENSDDTDNDEHDHESNEARENDSDKNDHHREDNDSEDREDND